MKLLVAFALKLCIFCVLTLPIEIGMIQKAQCAREAAALDVWRSTSKDENRIPACVKNPSRCGSDRTTVKS